MKRLLAFSLSILLILGLLTACGGNNAAQTVLEQPAETGETAPADDANDQSEPQSETEPAEMPEAPAVTLEFDQHAYENTNNKDSLLGLTYASNSSDKIAEASFRYKVYDTDGNVMSAYDPWHSRYNEVFSSSVFIPAGAKDYPISFFLADGLVYDMMKDEEMPEVGRVEYEFTGSEEAPYEDLRGHFTPGEYYEKEGHLYYPIQFDQEIADHYSAIYADYTILGYAGGELAAVCCSSGFPYGTTSWSVSYAIENHDGAFMAYHHIPYGVAIDSWEIYPGCIAAE